MNRFAGVTVSSCPAARGGTSSKIGKVGKVVTTVALEDVTLTALHRPRTATEIAEKGVIKRLGRVQHGVVDPHLREAGAQRLDVSAYERPVFVAERLGHDRHLLTRLQILERRRVSEAELELGGI